MTVPPPPGTSDGAATAQPVTYTTGPWVALVLDDLAVLLDLPADSRVLAQCWSAAAAGQGLDAVLGVITQPGPQSVADFAAVARTAEGTRVVVAGTGRADVSGSPLSAAGDATRDERLSGRPPVLLVAGTGEGADPAVLPLVRGIAPAGTVGVGVVAGQPAPQQAAQQSAVPQPPVPQPPVPQPPVPQPPVPPPPVPQPPVPQPPVPQPPVPQPPVPQPPVSQPPVEPPVPSQEPARPVDPVPVPRVSGDTMPPASVYDSGIIESLPWRGTGEERAPSEAAAPPPPPPPPAPSWGDPFAAGSGGGVADPHNPWGAPAPGAQPAWPDPNPPSGQQPIPPSPEPVPGTPPGGSWGSPGAAAPQPAASPWAPPGATAAEQLNPTSGATPSTPPDESGGPVVHAFACPRGHLNPPYAGTCRICDEPIPAQEGFAAPRPSLGVLKLSTGDTVPLDRDVVLGRAPFHADESAASRPHLVQLASPGNDISRSHVRINLENWFVQVTDLGSTNGTVVTLPDQAPVRLRPHDPFTILPGTSVNIADEVTLRYEVS